MLLIAAGSLWLFLAAVPVFADGGPHVAADNSGVNGINADGCAGCHRVHRAQSSPGNGALLAASSETALCLSCHGATGLGSTVDVENGIQYTLGTTDVRGASILGYTRGGGFITARIGSGEVARFAYASGTSVRMAGKVPVRSAGSQPVTSAHLPNTGGVIGPADGVAWGNGPNSLTPYAGPGVEMECGSCHNPHGNGQYRILQFVPDPAETGIDPFVPAAADVIVADAALPDFPNDTRNYTIIQTLNGTGTLLASQVEALGLPATAGDYFRRRVPWNQTSGAANDAPNGDSANFTPQISAWCLSCHTRYLSQGRTFEESDAIYKYRHTSNSTSRNCITCHVSHGSNAQMTGTFSAHQEYPGGAVGTVGDSRLLKVDNRGTCQICHDPTETVAAGDWVGPTPVPLIP
jgi:predicted CXXCH cytochrome family protein